MSVILRIEKETTITWDKEEVERCWEGECTCSIGVGYI